MARSEGSVFKGIEYMRASIRTHTVVRIDHHASPSSYRIFTPFHVT